MSTNVRKSIQQALKRSGKTRYWLAKKAGIRLSTVYDFFNGRNDITGENLAKLLDALDLEIAPKKKGRG